MNNGEQPDILAFGQAHPEVVIHRHERRTLPDGSHGTDQDAVDAFFAKRLKESAERAVLRLKRHRSSGDIAKNSACCQRSFSSKPRTPCKRR